MLLHGTCVALDGHAAIITGPSGSGKSDLALRFLMNTPATLKPSLISDDQTSLAARDGVLYASPPDTIAGQLEIRGVGIVTFPYLAEARVYCLVRLVAPEMIERLPQARPAHEELLGLRLPVHPLTPFEISADLKLRMILQGHIQ